MGMIELHHLSWRLIMRILFCLATLTTALLWGQDTLPDLEPPAVIMEDSNRFTKEFVKIMMAVGAMIGALLFLSWSSKKILNTQQKQVNESSTIKIVEQRTISTKTTVYQLDVEGRTVLLAESSNGVTLLHSTGRREPFTLKDNPSA